MFRDQEDGNAVWMAGPELFKFDWSDDRGVINGILVLRGRTVMIDFSNREVEPPRIERILAPLYATEVQEM